MDSNFIRLNTRPNVYKLSEQELLEIIIKLEPRWDNIEQIHTRTDMVDKIFQLWADHELTNHDNIPITCLICWDKLTNGNNLTFECGHKFHSTCIVKNVLIFSTDTYINYINDNEKKTSKIDFTCPQCKKSIDFVEFNKLENNNNNE